MQGIFLKRVEIEVFFQKSAVNGIIAYYGDSQGIHAD
jgi:hypothetical protein